VEDSTGALVGKSVTSIGVLVGTRLTDGLGDSLIDTVGNFVGASLGILVGAKLEN
jgi:hypothetical protein